MKNNFIKQGYHPSLINEHLESIILLNRSDFITDKDTGQKSDRIPLVIACNRFLSNISYRNHQNILQGNEIFKNKPITAFKRNKNIQNVNGAHWIENSKVKKDLKTLKESK